MLILAILIQAVMKVRHEAREALKEWLVPLGELVSYDQEIGI
jgi:hypothetical protein